MMPPTPVAVIVEPEETFPLLKQFSIRTLTLLDAVAAMPPAAPEVAVIAPVLPQFDMRPQFMPAMPATFPVVPVILAVLTQFSITLAAPVSVKPAIPATMLPLALSVPAIVRFLTVPFKVPNKP